MRSINMSENVSNPSFGMNTDGIIKINGREHTMYSSGDVFCSLTPDDLEAERQEARERYDKWQEMVMLEEASKMSSMDFFLKWQKWNADQTEYETYKQRSIRRNEEWKEDWDDYKYRMNTYDKEKATEQKITKWRKYHMIMDHIWAVILFVSTYLAWNDPGLTYWAYFVGMLFGLNVLDIVYKWSTYKKKKIWTVVV
jgi:hypothetical protein